MSDQTDPEQVITGSPAMVMLELAKRLRDGGKLGEYPLIVFGPNGELERAEDADLAVVVLNRKDTQDLLTRLQGQYVAAALGEMLGIHLGYRPREIDEDPAHAAA